MIDILFTLSLANFPRQGLSVAQPASVFTPLNNINLHVYFFFASLLPAVISPPGYSVDQKKQMMLSIVKPRCKEERFVILWLLEHNRGPPTLNWQASCKFPQF